MKVVLLAGGFGTRISEESRYKPKPMIEIGERPILWHIMKIYSYYGFNEFIICLGYKGNYIREYFANYFLNESDITFDYTASGDLTIHKNYAEPWKVTLVNTGLNTMTGGRVKRIAPYVNNETFMLTYGDGVANVNIQKLLEFHKSAGKLATVTAVQPPARFGAMGLDKNNLVTGFQEKPKGDCVYINGGFFVMEPEVFQYIEGDDTDLEKEPLQNLSKAGQLVAYLHDGYWQSMDTMKDRDLLDRLCNTKKAPWIIW